MSKLPFEKVVVIGASAGGVESLCDVVGGFDGAFGGVVLVALHTSPHRESALPRILERCGSIRASHPVDGQRLEAGRIYVAPPGHDLTVETGTVAVRKGAKENRFQPLIDALFHSAAHHYRQHAIGVVLSGALDDGTTGLWSIKQAGGTAIVEDPEQAQFSSMPLSASREVQVDYRLPASRIGPLLSMLSAARGPRERPIFVEANGAVPFEPAAQDELPLSDESLLASLMPFTCMECRPAFSKLARTAKSSRLPVGSPSVSSDHLSDRLQQLEQSIMLLQHVTRHMEARGSAQRARHWRLRTYELEARADALRRTVAHDLPTSTVGSAPK
ncbi:MAG TPA: chemotaxis protein CheB [Caldimonas sp.]|jgi:two-component system chemotaxis response regulator CheB|nr:chemotaxis protein CheB [Caldimonas sp.]HEX2542877.1 chemotaxis protein CheB [Caldimonas sp.]